MIKKEKNEFKGANVGIGRCCKYQCKSSNGYIWKYKN